MCVAWRVKSNDSVSGNERPSSTSRPALYTRCNPSMSPGTRPSDPPVSSKSSGPGRHPKPPPSPDADTRDPAPRGGAVPPSLSTFGPSIARGTTPRKPSERKARRGPSQDPDTCKSRGIRAGICAKPQLEGHSLSNQEDLPPTGNGITGHFPTHEKKKAWPPAVRA